MQPILSRRRLMQGAVGCSAVLALPAWATDPVQSPLQRLEQASGGTLGLWALDTGSGKRLSYRGEERFAFCSAFKAVLAGAILQASQVEAGLLQRRRHYLAAGARTVDCGGVHAGLEEGLALAQ
ncbi:hypothetical protein KUO17_15255 [Pseudomonas sp. MAFF 301350]|uniref:Beta-lactamase n=1 Tax=Pseudomonas aegrilactucae TaxID=2854028 RepID=A0A9Q2XL52_9PSED|nr:hypothetical protein [Pseudomonas aegrilactucae]MBV6288370.1 hypothetical protein [Pseudomonas aegrilactucae]